MNKRCSTRCHMHCFHQPRVVLHASIGTPTTTGASSRYHALQSPETLLISTTITVTFIYMLHSSASPTPAPPPTITSACYNHQHPHHIYTLHSSPAASSPSPSQSPSSPPTHLSRLRFRLPHHHPDEGSLPRSVHTGHPNPRREAQLQARPLNLGFCRPGVLEPAPPHGENVLGRGCDPVKRSGVGELESQRRRRELVVGPADGNTCCSVKNGGVQ